MVSDGVMVFDGVHPSKAMEFFILVVVCLGRFQAMGSGRRISHGARSWGWVIGLWKVLDLECGQLSTGDFNITHPYIPLGDQQPSHEPLIPFCMPVVKLFWMHCNSIMDETLPMLKE